MRKELIKRWLIRDKYHGEEHPASLRRDFIRLSRGEPIDYVIGWKEFCGAHIDLSLRPLIPREETEQWVRWLLPLVKKKRASRVLDLCAGSGAIGLAVLVACPSASVVFGDISPKAVRQVKKNLTLNSHSQRAVVLQSNLFENISGTFDFILSNPPYIPHLRILRLSRSVRNFEPHRALDGGDDGLRIVKKIITEGSLHLTPSGMLVVEVDATHATCAAKFAQEYFKKVSIHKDQYGRPRTLVLQSSMLT